MTLIEVVASLALLSALLAATLLGFGRHQRQLQRASQSIEAAELLDQLLVEWFSKDEPFPVNRQGRFSQAAGFSWSSTVIGRIQLADEIDTLVLRVSVHGGIDGSPLASVEIVDRYPESDQATGGMP